jgi:hypothetical protein
MFRSFLVCIAVLMMAPPGRLAICHRTGHGTYHLIEINAQAESAHRAHGDGRPGDVIPYLIPTRWFGPHCEIDP